MMKSVPRLLRGPYRITMRVALEEINVDDVVRQERPSRSCWAVSKSSTQGRGWTFSKQVAR